MSKRRAPKNLIECPPSPKPSNDCLGIRTGAVVRRWADGGGAATQKSREVCLIPPDKPAEEKGRIEGREGRREEPRRGWRFD